MATRRVSIRLTSENFEKVKADLLAMGPAGEAALRRIQTATVPASAGLLGLNRVASGIGAAFRSLTGNIFSVQGAILALAGGGLLLFVRRQLEAADAVAKNADKLQLSTDAYQRLAFAADLANVSREQFSTGIILMSKLLGQAAAGGNEAREFFQGLGIDIRDSSGKVRDATQIIDELADAYRKAGSGAERAAILSRAFGARSGAELANMLKDGSQGLRDAGNQAERLGIILSERTVRGAERAVDAITRLQKSLGATFMRTVADNSDAIERLANRLAELAARGGKGLADLLSPGRESLVKNIESIREAIARLEKTKFILPATDQINTLRENLRTAEKALADFDARAKVGTRAKLDQEAADFNASIKILIRSLREEGDQLGRAKDEQELYNTLKKVGLEDQFSYVAATRDLTMTLEGEEGARQKAAKAIRDQVAANQAMVQSLRELDRMEELRAQRESALERRAQAIRSLAVQSPEKTFADQREEADILLREGNLTLEEHRLAVVALNKEYIGLGEVTRDAGQVISTSLEDAFKRAKSAADIGRAALESFRDILLRIAVIKPFERAAGNLIDKAISGLSFTAPSTAPAGVGIGGGFATAHGAAFGPHGLYAFAGGGVVDRPTLFGFGGGRRGVMGEAGPEAVMPLARDSRGNLGVKAQGGSVTVNIIDQRTDGGTLERRDRRAPDGTQIQEIVIRSVRSELERGGLDEPMNRAFGLRRRGTGRA